MAFGDGACADQADAEVAIFGGAWAIGERGSGDGEIGGERIVGGVRGHLSEKRNRAFFASAGGGSIDDLLADSSDLGVEWAEFEVAPVDGVEEILDGVFEGWSDVIDGNGVAFGGGVGLDAEFGGVIGDADRASGSTEDKAAEGLGLENPGIGEGPPAGFDFGETVGVAADGHAVFIDFEWRGFIGDASDLEGFATALEPSADRGTVAGVIEKRTTAESLLVEPASGFHFWGGSLGDFVGEMIEWSTIATVMVKISELADQAFIEETLGGDVTWEPTNWPIDGEDFSLGVLGGDHGVGIGEGSGEGFFDENMDAEFGDFLSPEGVFSGGWTKDDQIRLSGFQAGAVVGEETIGGDGKIFGGGGHP